MNNETNMMRELYENELSEANGGVIPIAMAVTICIAAAAGGYKVGSDRANRDNRND